MFNEVTKTIEWGGKTLELRTGKIARQADGAVMVKMGHCTSVEPVSFSLFAYCLISVCLRSAVIDIDISF